MADEVERLRRVNGEWGLVMGVLIDGLAERNIKLPLGHRYTEVALAEIDRLRVQRDDYMVDLGVKIVERDDARTDRDILVGELAFAKAERDALAARLAAAEKVVEAVGLIHVRNEYFPHYCKACRSSLPCRTRAAVDAYRTHEPEPEQT